MRTYNESRGEVFNKVAWHAVSQQCEKDEKSGKWKPLGHELRRSMLEPSRRGKERKGGKAMVSERWNPFRDLQSMREAMDRLFSGSWGRLLDPRLPDCGDLPVDVAEKSNAFVVRVTIPGVRPEDIQANVRGDRLTLWTESQNEQERKDDGYVMRERYSASFYPALTLTSPVNTDQVYARYDRACCHVRAYLRVICAAP